MFKFSAVSQIWKKYIQKLNDWDLPLSSCFNYRETVISNSNVNYFWSTKTLGKS